MRANDVDGGQTVECFDLLIPHLGELIGGSVREERLELLKCRMQDAGLLLSSGEEGYDWYIELRKFGGAPHGGFGMGFERLVSWVTGQENVRECITMPRWAGKMLL
jgi:asparaginyl-tRNA synthetase